MNDVAKIIEKLRLIPHPEGGYYNETYRSTGLIDEKNLGNEYSGERSYSTCIYFLLTSDSFSAFHRIHQDEIWHFYSGSPIKIHMISEEGEYSNVVVGNDFDKGFLPQFVVKGGCWFASEVTVEDSYSLVGCTVSPGFDFTDFDLANRTDLIEKYHEHHEVISKLTNQ